MPLRRTRRTYTTLRQSDGLKPALIDWYDSCLAPELKAAALPADNVDCDVRLAPHNSTSGDSSYQIENEPVGWTNAGTGESTAENTLFVLSISEFNRYLELRTLNKQGYSDPSELDALISVSWWLRSPGSHEKYAPTVSISTGYDTDGPIVSASGPEHKAGFRPALWIQIIE